MLQDKIEINDAGQRLDKYLTKVYPKLSKSLQNKYIRIKRIKNNGKRCYPYDVLSCGDVLSLYINDDLLEKNECTMDFLMSGDIPEIIYEDSNILLVNKPAGLVVHQDNSNTSDTLINRIKKHLYNSGEYSPENEQSFSPALCNRIDRNTCGIVIAAKTASGLRIINEKIKSREIIKKYIAVIHGELPQKNGTLTNYLRKDESRNTVCVSDTPIKGGKKAITSYSVISQKKGISLVEINLETGRTHQIRAQFAHIGHPLVGDAKYGVAYQNKNVHYDWQMLCSCGITFSFSPPETDLDYLNGKNFNVKKIWFIDDFWNRQKDK